MLHGRRAMRNLTALALLTAAGSLLGCGKLGSQDTGTDCAGGKCDGQSEFARPVVSSRQPLALSNVQQERMTWPLWGSAFSLADDVRARISLTPTGAAGVVFAFPGDPEERLQYTLTWNNTVWTLAEVVGDGAPVQKATLRAKRTTTLVAEITDGGRAIRITSSDGKTAALTARTAFDHAETMGIYVTLAPGTKLDISDASIDQRLPSSELGTPLHVLANERGRSLGSTSETGEWPPRHDIQFESMYAEQFDTAGILDFYWTTTRGEDADFNFLPADMMVNYATVHGKTINGYFLVWDEELPEWVGELAESEGSEGLGAMLDTHIETIVGRYKGRVASWIVANESFLGPDENGTGEASYAESVWYSTLGPEFIERAFRKADAIDPAATLIYNETGAEAEGPKSDFMYARMRDLVQRNVPIDAVGFQFHVDAKSPPDMASVKRNMQRFAALGLDVLITELDVNLAQYPGTHAERLARQAELFKAVTDACLSVPACKNITTFGFSDKHAWDELGPAVCKSEGSTQLCSEPLLFTREYEPKPAYTSFRTALGG